MSRESSTDAHPRYKSTKLTFKHLKQIHEATARWFGAPDRLWRFVMWTAVIKTVISLSLIFSLAMLWPGLGQNPPPIHDTWFAIFAVLMAPWIETAIFQWAVIEIALVCKIPLYLAFFLSWGLFAYAHWPNGPTSFMAAGVVGGLFLSWTYVVWRYHDSRWLAFGVTGAAHALGNLILILPFWCFDLIIWIFWSAQSGYFY